MLQCKINHLWRRRQKADNARLQTAPNWQAFATTDLKGATNTLILLIYILPLLATVASLLLHYFLPNRDDGKQCKDYTFIATKLIKHTMYTIEQAGYLH